MASSRQKLNAVMADRILKLKQCSLEFERVLRWLDANNKEFNDSISNHRKTDKNKNINCYKISKRINTPVKVRFSNHPSSPRVCNSKTHETPTLFLQGTLIKPLPRKRTSGVSFFENLYKNNNFFVEESFPASGHNGTPESSGNKTDPEEFKFSDDSTKHSAMKLNENLNEVNGKMTVDLVTPGYVKQMINRFSAGHSNAYINGIADGNLSEDAKISICSFKVPLLHSTRSNFKSDRTKPFHYPVLLANRSSIPTKPFFDKSYSKNCLGNNHSSLELNLKEETKDSINFSNGQPKESSEFINSSFSNQPDDSEKHSQCITETQNGFLEQESLAPKKGEEAENVEALDTAESSLGAKNGNYFLQVMGEKEKELNKRCAEFDSWLSSDVPDEASGKIRSATGKASLLTSKKFQQFAGLCHSNLANAKEFAVTCEDLEGFWDLVMIQVSDIETLFAELMQLKNNSWKESNDQNELQTASHKQETPTRNKDPSTPAKSSKKNKASDLSAEKLRLRAAMQAGRRQRKTSQNEDEVQIFVAEKN